MIKVERKNGTTKVMARGDAMEFIAELLEATSSIFAEVYRDDMTEAEWNDHWEKWTEMCKKETENKRRRIKEKDPGIVTKVKKSVKMPREN